MKTILILSAAALALAACSGAPRPSLPPTLEIGALDAWTSGNTRYLTINGARPGWTTTQSGLQYRRIGPKRPAGRQPATTDTVKVHYRGAFVDGREFDSSYARNQPAEFPLNRVIEGWTEGVALMHEGEKFEFVIPASLGYGENWVNDELPPGSTLLFTIELLEVTPAG